MNKKATGITYIISGVLLILAGVAYWIEMQANPGTVVWVKILREVVVPLAGAGVLAVGILVLVKKDKAEPPRQK